MNKEIDPLIGKQLGVYQVQGSLGEGGMARVYKAYHPRLRREVAIKVILSQVALEPGFQARFEREAQVIASLQHPNIVSVYDFGEEGNLTYLVMQYVGGGTLRGQLRDGRPLSIPHAINYTIQMARALHHAHQHGIVHRDVKPQNMLVSSTDRNHLLLSDFGIAKLYGGGEDLTAFSEMPTRSASADQALTSVDQVIGTADYMSPEQASGGQVDARTDIYALGIVLYQMLTGEVPFHSTTLRGLLFQHVYTQPPAVRLKNPQVPEALIQITGKALAKAPGDRFQTAEEMARALELVSNNASRMSGSMLAPTAQVSYPSASGVQQTWLDNTAVRQQDSNATHSDAVTMAGRSAVTRSSGVSRPTTDPVLARDPAAQAVPVVPKRRRLPLSYLIAATVIILSMVVFGLHFYQSQSGGSAGTSGVASAFNETFHDNSRNWPSGDFLGNGITASVPGGGVYRVQVPQDTTAYPYPQAVGTLPDTFTLRATIKQTAGDALFGIAFHFTQDTSNHATCYALVISRSGYFQLLKCDNLSSPIYQGQYTPNRLEHTLRVIAQKSDYSFFVDGQALIIPTGSNASATTWSDSSLQGGRLALFLSGPGASYQISDVELTLA